MRILLCLFSILSPSVAMAHIGHLGAVAGHDHVIAGVAIGIAIAIGVAGALKGKDDEPVEADDDADDAPETSEA